MRNNEVGHGGWSGAPFRGYHRNVFGRGCTGMLTHFWSDGGLDEEILEPVDG